MRRNERRADNAMILQPEWLWRVGKRAAEGALDLLCPRRCAICDEVLPWGVRGCCASCARTLPWVHEPSCMKCGKPISRMDVEYCPDCAKYAHVFDRGTAAFTYTGRLRQSVYRMKADNRREYLDFYAVAMLQALRPRLGLWQPQLVLPVPMYWRKKCVRGYNQSELLAKRVGRLAGLPVDCRALACVRTHTAQKLLGRRERMQNLRGSFLLKKELPGVERVLLVDDVYTTGSTMDELARVLKQSGIQKVYFLVLCTGRGEKVLFRDAG